MGREEGREHLKYWKMGHGFEKVEIIYLVGLLNSLLMFVNIDL